MAAEQLGRVAGSLDDGLKPVQWLPPLKFASDGDTRVRSRFFDCARPNATCPHDELTRLPALPERMEIRAKLATTGPP